MASSGGSCHCLSNKIRGLVRFYESNESGSCACRPSTNLSNILSNKNQDQRCCKSSYCPLRTSSTASPQRSVSPVGTFTKGCCRTCTRSSSPGPTTTFSTKHCSNNTCPISGASKASTDKSFGNWSDSSNFRTAENCQTSKCCCFNKSKSLLSPQTSSRSKPSSPRSNLPAYSKLPVENISKLNCSCCCKKKNMSRFAPVITSTPMDRNEYGTRPCNCAPQRFGTEGDGPDYHTKDSRKIESKLKNDSPIRTKDIITEEHQKDDTSMESRRNSIERDTEEKFEEYKIQEQKSAPLESGNILQYKSRVEKNEKILKKSNERKPKEDFQGNFHGILSKSKNIDNTKEQVQIDSSTKKENILTKNENTENLFIKKSSRDDKAYFVLNHLETKKQTLREKGSKRSKLTNSPRYKNRSVSPRGRSPSKVASAPNKKENSERSSQPSCWLKEDRMPYLRDTCNVNLNSSCCGINQKNYELDSSHIPMCSSNCSNHIHTPYYTWCASNNVNSKDNHENNINSNSCTVLGKCTINENSKEKTIEKQTSDYPKSNLFSENTIPEFDTSRNFKSSLKKVSLKNKILYNELPSFFKLKKPRLILNRRRKNYFLLNKKKKKIQKSPFTQKQSECIPASKLEYHQDSSTQVDLIPRESKSISCNINISPETNNKPKKYVTFYQDYLKGTQSKSNLLQNDSDHLKTNSQNILNDTNSTKLFNNVSSIENMTKDNPLKKSDLFGNYDQISKTTNDFTLPWINPKINIYNTCLKPSSQSLILDERCPKEVARPSPDEQVEIASDSSGCEDTNELIQHALTAVQRARLAFSPKDLLTLNPSQAPGPSSAVLRRNERLSVPSTRLPGMPPRSDLILRTLSPRSRTNLSSNQSTLRPLLTPTNSRRKTTENKVKFGCSILNKNPYTFQ